MNPSDQDPQFSHMLTAEMLQVNRIKIVVVQLNERFEC